MTGEIIIEGKPFHFERLSWVYHEIPDAKFDLGLAKECLLLVKRILDSKSIPFLLMHGTLLGAYRDGGFIPHDIDIDLAIYEKDDEVFKSLIPELYEAGVKICRYHYGIIYSFIYKGVICDIDVIQHARFPYSFRYYRVLTELVPKKYLSGEKNHVFLGSSFLIPMNTEGILAYEYGKDWRIPQKGKQARISPMWMKPFKFVKKGVFFILRKLHLLHARRTMEE